MPVVPTGSPAWTRTASFSDYGGAVEKQNYLSRGVIDALTDIGAEEYSRAASDLAASARTSPAFVIRLTCNDAVPDAPTVHSVLGMIGVNTTGYDSGTPPGSFPGGARNSAGNISLFFETSYTDEYGVPGSFTVSGATATCETPGVMVGAAVSGNTVNVVFVDADGSPVSDATGTVVVW